MRLPSMTVTVLLLDKKDQAC
uniref:Uncharacterized protein n=1 Tax=Anguilla anguilla TaxID=7936 RepID=A0A0E9VCC5_ANGAN